MADIESDPTPASQDENDAREGVVAVLHRSRALGHLGPGPVEPHIDHALAFAGMLDSEPEAVLDLGSGGGLPGLVLAAMVWPAASWCLLDGSTRRAEFLREAVTELGLDARVDVDDRRAELAGRDPALRGAFAAVLTRSFGPPGVTAECAAPFLRVDGSLVVSEPPHGDREGDRWPASGLAIVGMGPARMEPGPPGFAVVLQAEICPEKYPRRVGIPAKRPFF